MNEITVSAESKKYSIYFETGFEKLAESCEKAKLDKGKAFVITDSNVSKFYIKNVVDELKKYFGAVYSMEFEAGEKNKNIQTVINFYNAFIEKRIDRKTVVFGLGGGVCGDMAGFAAATYLRGIKFVQLPTTLLSQVDSSVGGKVGIDFRNSKNIIGAFYQPEFVYINTDTLKTLPYREFAAGMAEVIKYGPILSSDFYDFVKENKEGIKALNTNEITEVIKTCCALKADVVMQDEKESGMREILNFGHTIGHAVESKMNFKLLHGECVAIGMSAALEISVKRGYTEEKQAEDIRALLKYFGLKMQISGVNAEEIYEQMFLDKKVRNNKINFVLMKKMGACIRTEDVTKDEIMSAIKYILR